MDQLLIENEYLKNKMDKDFQSKKSYSPYVFSQMGMPNYVVNKDDCP